jgi:hypothetical protein
MLGWPSGCSWPTTASSGRQGTKHGDLDDIDVLISDAGLTDDQYCELRTAGIDVERS